VNHLSPGLADAADVLSDQLHVHLQRLAGLLAPHAESLDRRFLAHLKKRGFEPKIRIALNALTPGSAARVLSAGEPALKFIEQVEYYGRRLAKLNLPPASVAEALQEYDRLLTPILKGLKRDDLANFQWVREQLQFCVILTLNNAYYQVRENETRAFYELFRVELESRNLGGLLQQFLQTLMQVCKADAGHLYMLNDARTAWVLHAKIDLAAPARPALQTVANRPAMRHAMQKSLSRPQQFKIGSGKNNALLDPSWKNRFQSCWSVPLAAGGRTAGVMQFGFSKQYEWLPREQELLAAAAERCLVAAEKARLLEDLAASEEQIRKLAEHMLHVEEMERRRISAELHDEAGQSLLCIRLQLEMIEQAMPSESHQLTAKLREAREMTEHTILEMRRLIAALSPAVLEQLGLGAALRQLVNRFRRLHPMRVRLSLGRLGRLPQQTEVILYRLVQECCNNIGKHSAATSVNISVSSTDGKVRLAVEDNGVGFRLEEALARRDSFGIAGMRERVALLGGQFEVVSYPVGMGSTRKQRGRGTRISISLPIAKDAGIRPDKTIRSRQTRAAIVRAAKILRASAV
jgi:signal transduction histidine kinase